MSQLNDIFEDSKNLSACERVALRKFSDLVSLTLAQFEPPGSEWESISMFALSEASGIDLCSLAKEGPMLCAMWVCMLIGIKTYLSEDQLKYPKFEDFIEVYENEFNSESEEELKKLWQNANWMNILFKFLPARKNKGLAMLAVPRLVEGWHKKYVTGSGQTQLTANRVKVFETEGDTKPNQRGKIKPKSPKKKKKGHQGITTTISRDTNNDHPHPIKRHRRASLDSSSSSYGFHTRSTSEDWDPSRKSLRLQSVYDKVYPITTELSRRRSARFAVTESARQDGAMEVLDIRRQQSDGSFDVKNAFNQFAGELKLSRDESFGGLLICSLSRSNSLMAWITNEDGVLEPTASELEVSYDALMTPTGLPLLLPEFFKVEEGANNPSIIPSAFTPERPRSPQSVTCSSQALEDDKVRELFGPWATCNRAPPVQLPNSLLPSHISV